MILCSFVGREVVWQLVDVVSKNGNLILNIGPQSNGTISNEAQTVLRESGAWLRVNGEAIYSTRTWRLYGVGPTKVAEGAFHDRKETTYTAQDFPFTTECIERLLAEHDTALASLATPNMDDHALAVDITDLPVRFARGLPHSEAILRLLQSTWNAVRFGYCASLHSIAEKETADLFEAAGTSEAPRMHHHP